jgi:dihydroxy-acid dehydratase
VTQANKGCDFDFLEEPLKAIATTHETAAAADAGRNEPEIH